MKSSIQIAFSQWMDRESFMHQETNTIKKSTAALGKRKYSFCFHSDKWPQTDQTAQMSLLSDPVAVSSPYSWNTHINKILYSLSFDDKVMNDKRYKDKTLSLLSQQWQCVTHAYRHTHTHTHTQSVRHTYLHKYVNICRYPKYD